MRARTGCANSNIQFHILVNLAVLLTKSVGIIAAARKKVITFIRVVLASRVVGMSGMANNCRYCGK